MTANITLFAKWTNGPFTVTFDSMNGSPVDPVTVYYGAKIAEPNPAPTRDGYTLDAWYCEKACITPWDFDGTVTGDITLYAQWVGNDYKVTFETQDGQSPITRTIQCGSAIPEMQPEREGYKLVGWFTESACQNAWDFTTGMMPAHDLTLWAKWRNTFIVTFDSQGGSGIASQCVSYEALAVKPTDPTKTGCIFGGWYSDPQYDMSWDFNANQVTDDVIIYAKWLDFLGSGTEKDPYVIDSADRLVHLAQLVNSGTGDYDEVCYALTGDISLSSISNWTSIGNSPAHAFSGQLEGNGHTINGLKQTLSVSDESCAGLFGYVDGGTIQNLTLAGNSIYAETTGAHSTGSSFAGGIAGHAEDDANILNCTVSVSGNIDARSNSDAGASLAYAGGIVGYADTCYISGCAFTGSLVDSDDYAGGITGGASGTQILGCYNAGKLHSSSSCGGIAGYAAGGSLIQDSYCTADLTGDINAGGIAGEIDGSSMENCYFIGSMDSSVAGGLVGKNIISTFTHCYYLDRDPTGCGSGTEAGTQITPQALLSASTFSGFDFKDVWTMAGSASYPYPELKGMPYKGVVQQDTYHFDGGSGLPTDPYRIRTKQQLYNLYNNVYAYYLLENDIVFTDADFAPGGAYYNQGHGFSSFSRFSGVIDGGGHAIRNLQMNSTYGNSFGLFKDISCAVVKNLYMLNCNVSASDEYFIYCGGIVGYAEHSAIRNCAFSGNVTATITDGYSYCYTNCGGIAGAATATVVEGCYNLGTIQGTAAGGIMGDFTGNTIIQNCFNGGTIASLGFSSNGAGIGGIAGNTFGGSILGCYNTGTVSGGYAGGIVGYQYFTTVSNCYYKNNISVGMGSGTDTAVKKPDTEMKQQGTYAGFDFTNVWTMAGSSTYLYPELRGTPQVCQVSIDPNDGDSSSVTQFICGSKLADPGLTRPGYTLAGWYRESSFITQWDFAADTVGGDMSLFAKWLLNDCTVTFNSQNGTGVASQSVPANTKIAVPTAPTRTGYTFGGWYRESGCVTAWNFDTDFVTGSITLFAKWTINTCSVTFDSQGGSAVAAATVNYNSTISAPAVPTHTGYTFVGWYKEQACWTLWNFSADKVTGNITLWARWLANTYKVTFNSQGGSAVSSVYALFNTAVPAPAQPARTGYVFMGWYEEAACANAWNFTTDMVPGNITIYARWELGQYTVTFDAQGGSSVAGKTVGYNTLFPAPLIPERTGYTFKGWYKEAAFKHAWSFAKDKMPAGNITLWAKWAVNSFAVAFNSQGGSAVKGKTANYGALIAAPANPKHTGYTFGGWYKEQGCQNPWNFGADTVAAATTLWAKWTINTYTVTFNAMGGLLDGNPSSSVPADYGAKISVPKTPVKAGYIFGGWYTNAKCTTQWNFSMGTVSNSVILYAKWNTSDYTVTFNATDGWLFVDNGVTTMPYKTAAVSVGYQGTIPSIPLIRDGYYFDGWYTSPKTFNASTQWVDTRRVTGNVTLYARWAKTLPAPAISEVKSTANGSVRINFPSVPYATSYDLDYSTDSKFYGTVKTESVAGNYEGTPLTITVDGLDASQIYYFRLRSIHTESGHEVTVFTGSWSPAFSEIPGKTGSVLATAASYNSIQVGWSDSGIYRYTGYEVWRATSASGKYALVGSPATPAFTDTVNTGTAYWYKVRAYRLNGAARLCGPFSDAVQARCALADITHPSAASASTTSVAVSWDAVDGATMYEVWVAPADTGVYKLLAATASPGYTQAKLVTGQPYYYKVRAYRLVGKTKIYGNFTSVLIATPAR